ncbi:branched-chain amino acid ABC transporter substrate-binding protein [Pseudonocardia benzenivorans]|uniref:Extracellular ligand-binding receptor n=2 Tax=Pseudonocardia TaxID=1847 RepID=F4CN30_PSEUX|nr:branched-chain amino acid ABC transporter substrate-binding protein [Pseudonocardia dioxanivorans]AEA26043.1 Extracellular ligand-binding receptor [Pseudonocardia dioxanivorans CB1190]GJF02608.1 putative ABC transporter/extracellular ligand-binding receptor [Pseudonocardia sp. D17]
MARARRIAAVASGAVLAVVLAGCAANQGASTDSGAASASADIPAVTTLPVPPDAQKPAGNGQATCSGVSIAFAGAQSGGNAQLGINILNGVQLAINQHNQANPNCQVTLKKFDTEGDPGKAPGIVTQVTSDSDIIGVVGLPFSGESKATGAIFEQAGLVHLTPSATNPTLTQNGWTTFFRALGNDNVQGPAAAKFITGKLGAKKVCVIQDDSDYGIGLANATNQALGAVAADCQDKVTTGQKDFSAVASKVIAAKPDAVFYSGYYAEGAPLDQQLVTKGFTGKFVGPDGVKDDKFIQQAGDASNNAFFTCPCVPGELLPDFASAYQGVSGGSAPGTYSLEGYDSTTILLRGIDSGIKDRAALKDYVKNYDADGFSKHFKWDSTGELATTAVYGYKVDNGKIVYIGTIG